MDTQNCLICASVITPNCKDKIDKLDALFLLRILLEIPQDNQLFENFNNSLSLLQICDICENGVKQCKQIYSEISENIERFWEHQNKVLEKISQDVNINSSNNIKKGNYYDSWAIQCRKFVRDHDFSGFGYPFIVHDLETLLISTIPPCQSSENVNCTIKNQPTPPPCDAAEVTDDSYADYNDSPHISEDPSEDIASPSSQPFEQSENLAVKQEPESEEEQGEDDLSSDQDNDSDYTPSPSKKPRIFPSKKYSPKNPVKKVTGKVSQIQKPRRPRKTDDYPKFSRDPSTNKFHCSWSSDGGTGTCTQAFAEKRGLHYHWDRHRKTPRQICKECPLKFYSQPDLIRHTQLKHSKKDDKFECEICGKGFGYREAVLRHKRSIHDDEKKVEERLARERKKEEDPIKRDPVTNKWICWWPNCGKTYMERREVKYHLDKHKGTPQQNCEECGELFYTKFQLINHKQLKHETDKEICCEICGDKFSCKTHLYFHRTYRHSESGTGVEIVCEICGARMKKGSLNVHLNSVHSEVTGVNGKKFCCHKCPGRFAAVWPLKMHLWRVHQICDDERDLERLREKWEGMREKGRRTWRCQVKGCRIVFVTEEGLKKHVEGVHGGREEGRVEGKLKCEVCGKGFHVKQKLARHLGTVHAK